MIFILTGRAGRRARAARKKGVLSLPEKKISPLYRVVRGLVRLCYPKMEVVGAEKLPEGPTVVVANHTQMNGPIACELYFPGKRRIWCAGQMMRWKEVPTYAYQDFWSQKPKAVRWLYRILACIITPLSVLVFNNAQTIPVYRDMRLSTTFKLSMAALQDGCRVVIFPEHDVKYNNILYDFQDRFIDLARMYYKKTGEELSFVPMYIAPKLKKMCIGEPIRFRAAEPITAERERIRTYLMEQITRIARALPEHTVVPYRNIPKRLYPSNLAWEKDKE